ncbi:MAG: FadR family transcriptional regulator [Planctomycetota bacterium]|jgi:DNA-binding FadR family transcriptional regulator|nr:FadR family transcriptional regulator [Planctomycetota bacterium]
MKPEDRQATLSHYVYEELLKRINGAEFTEGSRLPSEGDLARQFGVSRPVVREALAMLRDDGIIHSRRGAGSFLTRVPDSRVLTFTPIKDLEDIQRCYDFRYVLEGEIAYRAAMRHDAHDKKNMQKAFDAQDDPGVKPGIGELEVDLNFHLAIAKATHNRFFHEAILAINQQMLNSMKVIHYLFNDRTYHRQIKFGYHGAVLRAILDGDADAARLNMQLHIINTRDYLFKTKNDLLKY